MVDATLVAIHGFGSSPATWDRLNAIWSSDKELRGLLIHPFGYPSPRVPRRRPFSTRRIPDYDDIAQSFANRYEVHYKDAAAIAIVTHSQGGLILQRFLAWMVREGRGRELARIRTIVMLACPSSGSEYLSSLRRALGYHHSPQARSLETLDKQVADAQRTVLQRVVYATGVDDLQCRIPFHVYAGDSDQIVPAASAQATFPRAGVLPGDHFSILGPGAPGNATAETVKHYLLADLAAGQASSSRRQAASSLPLVGQVTDRAVLGIHPAIPLPPGADPALSRDLPLYIPRDIDASLRAWATAHCDTGGFLLLTGPAAVGKSRSAYQLIRDIFPDWPLLMPATAEQLVTYNRTTPTTAGLIVWLNEIQDYLGPGGLTAASIRRLLNSPQPVIIIGTIWPARYDALTAQPPASTSTSSPDSLLTADPSREAREILTILADRKDLPAELSPDEQRRAASIAQLDPRIAEALADPDVRVTETLAAAPNLISRWVSAANPYGAAVITAATAARRCGHPQPLPPEVLQPLAQDALTPALLAQANVEWFTSAVEWARQPVRGRAAPLTPQAIIPAVISGDNVSDILVQHAAGDPTAPWHHVPETVWRRLIDKATPQACVSIADAAYPKRHSHHTPITQHALEKAADAGNLDAMFMLALMLHDRKDPGLAERWYRKAADSGHSGAMYYLGFLLADQGDIEHAERWYRKAANAGNFGAMSNLAVLLQGTGTHRGSQAVGPQSRRRRANYQPSQGGSAAAEPRVCRAIASQSRGR